MISNAFEFEKAKEELEYLHSWLQNLSRDVSAERSGFTEVSVRSMIARINHELSVYQASRTEPQSEMDQVPQVLDDD